MTEELGLNRKLVRAIYPAVDWDEYDREVVLESEVVTVLERFMSSHLAGYPAGAVMATEAYSDAHFVLGRLRGTP